MRPIGHLATAAASTSPVPADLRDLQVQLLVDAAAASLVLVVATTLSVYKPRGVTPRGRRS